MSNVKLKEIQNKEHLISKELNEFSNLCLSYLNKQNNVYEKLIKQKSIYEAVYIEFRNLSHSEFIIKNCIIKLDNKWSHTVICCNDNYYHTKELCDRINKNINIIKLDITNATYNYYNNLLLSKEFWEMLNGEKILIYQSDSLIYNSNIDDFLKYDYIGMPFLFKHYISAPSTVGNGGLSLRSKKTMLEVLNNPNCDKKCSNIAEHFKLKTKFDNIPEDIFFSHNIQNLKLGLVPDDNVGKLFASSDNINCFGMHAIWKYNKSWKPLIVEFMEKNYNEKVEICKKIKIDTNSHLIPYPSNSFLHESSGTNEEIDNTENDANICVSEQNYDKKYLNKIKEYCCLTNKSLTNKKKIFSNPKEEFRYFCYRYMDYIRMLELPIINQNSIYEAVLIEFRCLPHLEFLIRNCIYKLGYNWSHTIVCGLNNFKFISNISQSIDRNIKIIKLEYENLKVTEYNELLKTKEFWKLFVGEKLLIYQEDSCIFKSNIEDFLKWDYIGAPWPPEYKINKNSVGNGGFSLRSKNVMIKCLDYAESIINISPIVSNYMKNNNITTVPEDVYFTNIIELKSIGKLADFDSALKFSCESFKHNYDCLGGHQFWLNNVNWKNLLYKNVIVQFSHRNDLILEHRGGWGEILNCIHKSDIYNVDSDIVFYDIIEKTFIWEKKNIENKKWFGIIHCTENTPNYLDDINISNLFKPKSHFLNNIHNCLCLIALSPNVVNFININLKRLNINLNVFLLNHPINKDLNIPKFSINAFQKNTDKKILQIGQQLRKITSLYTLKIDTNEYKKVWLTGTKNFNKLNYLFNKECDYLSIENININDIEMKYTDVNEYDNLLSKNIVFVDLFDAAANNTVLECIIRKTPLIINRLPATVYYLGENYPLFFENIDEVPSLITIENIKKSHNYLKNINTTSINEFMSNLINIIMKQRVKN